MSRSARAIAIAAVAAAAGLAVPVVAAQEPDTAPTRDLTFPVRDLDLETSSLDRSVRRTESKRDVTVTLAADVLFAFDSARLSPRARSRIAEAAREIRRADAESIEVTGHTDSKGGDAYNLRLSRNRADAVRQRLEGALGGAAPRIGARGLGETRPVAANRKPNGDDSPRGRARNRRVEIRIPGG